LSFASRTPPLDSLLRLVDDAMKNATWVCFDCRESVRRPDYALKQIPCPTCGQAMGYVGDRIRIPSKRQRKAWRELWESIHASATPITKLKGTLRAWRIRRLNEQIAALEAAPTNASRARTIKAYREELAALLD
jgi:hypothetical protein